MSRERSPKKDADRGATAVEYALIVGLVSLLIVASVVSMGVRFEEYTIVLADHVAQLLG